MKYEEFLLLTNYNVGYGSLIVEKNIVKLREKESSAEDYGNNLLNFLLKITPSISLTDYKEIKNQAVHDTLYEATDPYSETTFFEEKINLKNIYEFLNNKELLNQYENISQTEDECDRSRFVKMLNEISLAYPEDFSIDSDSFYISKTMLFKTNSSEEDPNLYEIFKVAFDFNNISNIGMESPMYLFKNFLRTSSSIYDDNTLGNLNSASEDIKKNKDFKKINIIIFMLVF